MTPQNNYSTEMKLHTIGIGFIILVSYLIARFVYPVSQTDSTALFGMVKVSEYVGLNNVLFLSMIGGGYAILIVVSFIKFKDNLTLFLSKNYLVWLILTASLVLYLIAIETPMISTKQLWGLAEAQKNLISTILYLFDENETLIAGLLVVFTLIFPLFKYTLLYMTLVNENNHKWSQYLSHVSKFSMLDVFTVGLLIVIFLILTDCVVGKKRG